MKLRCSNESMLHLTGQHPLAAKNFRALLQQVCKSRACMAASLKLLWFSRPPSYTIAYPTHTQLGEYEACLRAVLSCGAALSAHALQGLLACFDTASFAAARLRGSSVVEEGALGEDAEEGPAVRPLFLSCSYCKWARLVARSLTALRDAC